jgi:ATP-binding cassette subfamily B protein
MDEATSALDFDTEKQLCNNLQNWASGKTVFFITHRLSTISESELIVVMSKGSIRETGSHENLMRLNGRYCALYRQQQAVN